MLKLNVYLAAGVVAAALPVAQARSQTPTHTMIEDVDPLSRPARQDLSPIVVNVSASSRNRTRPVEPSYIRNFARIPTYPSWYERVHSPLRTFYTSSYQPGFEASSQAGLTMPVGVAGDTGVMRTTYAAVSWGQAVPVVEVRPRLVPTAAPPCVPAPSFGEAHLEGEEVLEK